MPRLPMCVPPRDFHQYCKKMSPSSAPFPHALWGDEMKRMPSPCKIDPDRRGEPLVDPGMFPGFAATPPVTVGGAGGAKNPPSPPPAPAVRRLTHARERCRTLVVSICASVLYRRCE